MDKKLIVGNIIQRALWENEIMGQISDGKWENSRPLDHWESWSDAKVEVSFPQGRNFYVRKDNYNLVNGELIEAVGERMTTYARLAHKFPELVEKLMDANIRLPCDYDCWLATHDYAIEQRLLWRANGLTREMFDEAMACTYINIRRVKIELRGLMRAMRTKI